MHHKALCAALCLVVAAAFLSKPVVAAPGQSPDPAKRAERRQKVLEKFDSNGNGQLDPDEHEAAREAMQKRRAEGGGAKGQGDGGPNPERRQKIVERFDKDGDGKLSESERAEAKAAKGARAKKGR